MELGVVVRVHVDETRRQHQPIGVDHLVGGRTPEISHLRDTAVAHLHVGGEAGHSRAVHDVCTADEQLGAFHGFSVPKSTGRTSGLRAPSPPM